MKKTYVILNFIVTIGVIFWSYLSNTLNIEGNTIASLNAEYDNLFTPAGYAFSIWGLIYLGLIALSIFQIKRVFFDKKDDEFVLTIGPWLLVAIFGSGLWLFVWLTENTGWSVVVMLTILASLLTVIVKLNMQLWNAPSPIKLWVWLPINLFSGWISVATIANVSAYLVKINWSPGLSEITWTLIMMAIAVVVNLAMVHFRNMRGFGCIGVWALIGIAVKHWNTIPILQWAAVAGAIIVFAMVCVQSFRKRAV